MMFARIIVWGAIGALAGALLGAGDALIIVINASAMFFDTAEMGRTIWMALGICAGAGALFTLLLGVGVETIGYLAQPGKPLHRPWRLELIIVALAVIPISLLNLFLTRGPQASQIPFRTAAVLITAIIGAASIAFVITRSIRWMRTYHRARYILATVSLLISVVLVLVDLKMLIRLYPVFHGALTVLAMITAATGLSFLAPKKPKRIIIIAAIIIMLGAMGVGGFALDKVRGAQNSRFVLKSETPTTSDVLSVARGLFSPPARLMLYESAQLNDSDFDPTSKASRRAHVSLSGSPVILLTVDAMRFDRIGVMIDGVLIAPNMSALAERSVVFEKAYTPLPHTSYAISSLLTGKYTGPLFDVPGAPEVHETWPEILHRFRYKTAGFFTKAVFFIDRARFEPYLRKGYGFGTVKMDYLIPALERVEQTIDFLKERRKEGVPVFTWTHFFEPHEPYDDQCLKFGSEDFQRYNCEINVVDEAIGHLLDYLDEAYPKAIIIVTADHGEEFKEHGGLYHGTTLYDEQIRVPLFIKAPQIAPRSVVEPVNLVDILGTVLSLLEIPAPARMRSNDLTGLMSGDDDKQRTAFCQVHELVTAVKGDYKLIIDREEQIASLYDLRADPAEKRSVAGKHPEIVNAMTREIGVWLKSHAYWELRPVKTDKSDSSWPVPIQKALSGDSSVAEELLAIAMERASELSVRRKAAELYTAFSELGRGGRGSASSRLRADDDPQVRAWLELAALSNLKDEDIKLEWSELIDPLEPHSLIWTRLALARFEDDRGKENDGDVIAILGKEETAIELRKHAARLLGEVASRRAIEPLTKEINNYQLSLDVVRSLAQIGNKKSRVSMITRLKRERFPERRASVVEALRMLNDRRSAPAIATELSRDEPTSNALVSLLQLKVLRANKPGIYQDEKNNKSVMVSPGRSSLIWDITGDSIQRIVILTSADSDGGSVVIMCNDLEVGRLPVLRGDQQGYIESESCSADQDGSLELSLVIEPKDNGVKIKAIGVVRSLL